jgi:AraC-like DNA-binding protein
VAVADGRSELEIAAAVYQALLTSGSSLPASAINLVTGERCAATANINRFHLLRIFKRTVGVTPHAYVTVRRVARGKTLLAQGVSVADAALAVGFFDQSHFANRFRQTYGMTPRTFQLGSGVRDGGDRVATGLGSP